VFTTNGNQTTKLVLIHVNDAPIHFNCEILIAALESKMLSIIEATLLNNTWLKQQQKEYRLSIILILQTSSE
jgi:c-di-GMP-binding flagellar brake protein YcgR